MVKPRKSEKLHSKPKKKEKVKVKDLRTLGEQLLTSRAHINNLPILLTYITPNSPPQHALQSLLPLQAFFTPLLPKLPPVSTSTSSNSDPDPEFIYLTWLRSKFDDLVRSLIELLVSSQSEDALREVVLDAIMEFVKVGNAGKFHSAIYHKLLRAVVHSALGIGDIVLDLLATKYFCYIDVCYFTYISLEKQARTLEEKEDGIVTAEAENNIQSRTSMELSIHKMYILLSRIPPLEVSEENLKMWNGLGVFVEKNNAENIEIKDKHGKNCQKSSDKVLSSRSVAKKMKPKFTKAWMSFLRLPLPLHVYKEVLVTLHQAVIPYLSNPIMLCDFLTRSYDIGGVISVMALSGLFILMTQHGLEYPNFYDKLYALLEPAIFIAKHRAKFFQLLDSCLKSSLLPAYLAAAFCKKLSRLALFVPPAGALVIIALVNNLLQRHTSINCLVHHEGGIDTTTIVEKNGSENAEDHSGNRSLFEEKPGIDHFKNEENDPKATNALRSSLWEIDTIRHHYCAPVSRFVMSVENDLAFRARIPEIAVKDFSSGSYATIFNAEIRRRVKKVPLGIHKATPTSLFSESDFSGWTFNLSNEEFVSVNGSQEPSDDMSAKRQRTAPTEA